MRKRTKDRVQDICLDTINRGRDAFSVVENGSFQLSSLSWQTGTTVQRRVRRCLNLLTREFFGAVRIMPGGPIETNRPFEEINV